MPVGTERGATTSGTGPLSVALLTYSTRPRGGVVATLALAEALARAGHQVDLWTLARGGDTGFFRPVDPSVRVRAVPFPDATDDESVGQRILRSIAVLGEAFDAHRATGTGTDSGTAYDYDVVHAQDCISANAVVDCIRTVHHLDTFTTPELVTCHERALRRPRAHVCVSTAVAAELAAGWGIDATVIPNGVDAARFTAAAAPRGPALQARERWRSRLGRYVLTVGGIEPRKGTSDLIEAFALLRGRSTPVSLVLAGGETLFDYRGYRDHVLARAAELGVEPVLLGPVPDEELPALVAAASVFAFPSAKEGFGLAALEALAAGVPVVTRDLPVLREVLGAAGSAVSFASSPTGFAAALDRVLDAAEPWPGTSPDPARTAAGRAVASRFSWDLAASRHVAFYRALQR
ncbi:MSMEG_0565 family glycosyltransferase [Parafrankia sp. EUN1f]|uniref:MSMEG_0565 family glycosyltransferase n=1 Tax=Parafrankia sp. EUN1f TaxID=102897 RepID=UPI0001C46C5B|nr:MSMEG_0565 family glycosyltransferase [Parafrankia sp. EUN1f]EFC80615.1 glycosyl transferase group 1 [Parafrankia sp. EUN1f]